METLNELLESLNNFLETENPSFDELCMLKIGASRKFNHKILLCDITHFTADNFETILKIRQLCIQASLFAEIVHFRNLEKICMKYIEYKIMNGIQKSTFIIHEGNIVYLCMGNAKNDHLVLKLITRKFEIFKEPDNFYSED